MSALTLRDLFTYQPPTERTTPRYASVRAAEAQCLKEIGRAFELFPPSRSYEAIDEACFEYAAVIDGLGDIGPEDSQAVDCIRLARMAANESITSKDARRLHAIAKTELQKARWWACAGIALKFR